MGLLWGAVRQQEGGVAPTILWHCHLFQLSPAATDLHVLGLLMSEPSVSATKPTSVDQRLAILRAAPKTNTIWELIKKCKSQATPET